MGSVTRTKLMSIMALWRDDRPPPHAHPGCDPCPCWRRWRSRCRLMPKKRAVTQRSRRARTFITKRKVLSLGPPAPKTTDGEKDYPRYNFESRVLLWFANQQHLYYGSFVLAVPIFCMVIEFMGVVTKDKAMAKRYDQLAYDFIKISSDGLLV
jgi:cytochrome d ubiquinol oxidase subunit I